MEIKKPISKLHKSETRLGLAEKKKITSQKPSKKDMQEALKAVNQYFVDLQNRYKLTPKEEKIWAKVSKVIIK